MDSHGLWSASQEEELKAKEAGGAGDKLSVEAQGKEVAGQARSVGVLDHLDSHAMCSLRHAYDKRHMATVRL